MLEPDIELARKDKAMVEAVAGKSIALVRQRERLTRASGAAENNPPIRDYCRHSRSP